jgi:predicted ArsR family transcriptional regulator
MHLRTVNILNLENPDLRNYGLNCILILIVMQNTRTRILQYLALHRQATAVELSTVLDLTAANIRHHLKQLAADGSIEIIGQTEPDQPGRPAQIYMLTRTAQDDSLDELASALLRAAQINQSASGQAAFLGDTARQIAGQTPEAGKSITIRLSQAVRRLNELNYQAHWEAHPDTPHLMFGRCPYARIITRHPELCQMDAELLAELTGERFEQIEKIDRTRDGPAHCRFRLIPK